MRNAIGDIIVLIIAVIGIVVAFIFGRRKSKQIKDNEKIRKERENEQDRINSMDAADVVDNLDNASDVRAVIDEGKRKKDQSISDRLKRVFQRIGGKGTDKKDNA